MLTRLVDGLVAHDDASLRPHDALTAWSWEPLAVGSLALAAALFWRGRPQRRDDGRARAWWLGWTALVVAILSPVDAVAGVLLSAHMVQHVLLVTVAAPLIARAAPGAALLRGIPGPIGRRLARLPARLGIGLSTFRRLRSPVWRWLVFVGTFWLWHASAIYGAAVESPWLHRLEHLAFFLTALWLWAVIVGPARVRVDRGTAVFGVFLLSLQTVLLATLLTFANAPFYDVYAAPAPGWGIDPLTDQRLAGLIMWIPSGLILVVVGIALFVRWFQELEAAPDAAGEMDADPVGWSRR